MSCTLGVISSGVPNLCRRHIVDPALLEATLDDNIRHRAPDIPKRAACSGIEHWVALGDQAWPTLGSSYLDSPATFGRLRTSSMTFDGRFTRRPSLPLYS